MAISSKTKEPNLTLTVLPKRTTGLFGTQTTTPLLPEFRPKEDVEDELSVSFTDVAREVPGVIERGRQAVGEFLSPDIQTAEEIEEERQQSLPDEEIIRIRTEQAKQVGAIPLKVGEKPARDTEYVLVDPFGAVGTTRRVTGQRVKSIFQRAREKFFPKVTSKTPTPQPFHVPEGLEVSGVTKLDAKVGKIYRANPATTPEYIAQRTMKDGRKIPAIRRDSGVFAEKDFEVFDFKDIKETLGGMSNIFRDVAFSLDNLTAPQAAKRGGFGPMVQLAYKHEEALASRFAYVGTKSASVRNIAQQHGVKINKKTGQQLFDALEGKTTTPQMAKVAKEVRKLLNTTREEANQVRKSMGKEEIGFIKNYAPWMQKTSFWRTMITDPRTTITDNFDFIIPNSKLNPHAIPRTGAEAKKIKTNAWELIETYVDNISNDIYISPQIEKIKAVDGVLKGRGFDKTSKFLDGYVRNNLVGKPGVLDSYLGITEGTARRALLTSVNIARNISALAFNIVWTAFVQPASVVLTLARGGGTTRGLQNTIRGFTKFAFDTTRRARVKKLPTLAIKTEGQTLGMTGAGDIDRMGASIIRTPIESFNSLVGKVADSMEYFLTGGSMSVGYEHAARLGFKGRNADIFANWLGGATQSQYNREARTVFQNSLLGRSAFPFSTYMFEAWRFWKTIVGRAGGIPLEKTERFNQAIMFMAGAYLYNQYLEAMTGRQIFSVGSNIPIVGGVVDKAISEGRVSLGMDKGGDAGTGRAPIAPFEDIKKFGEALDAFVNEDNFQPMRKEVIKWGMGFTGIAGASTMNRFVDGMIADAQGYQVSRTGEPLFVVEGFDKIVAPLLGPYSTKAGKAYLDRMETKEENENRIRPIYEEIQALNLEGQQGEAQRVLDSLSEADYKIYKSIRTKDKAEERAEGVNAMIPIVQEARDLVNRKKEDEAQQLVESLTEQEYEWYESAKKQLDKMQDAKDGIKPSFGDGEVITDRGLLETVAVYAEALGVSPIDALSAIFEGETIRRVDNRTVVVFRMPFQESQAIRTQWAEGRNLNKLKLDHVIPLQLGGTNSDDNLRLVPTAIWEVSTPIENRLGELLRDNKIEKKEARQLIIDFKAGKIGVEDIP